MTKRKEYLRKNEGEDRGKEKKKKKKKKKKKGVFW